MKQQGGLDSQTAPDVKFRGTDLMSGLNTAGRAAFFAMSTALEDQPWRDLGFGKRPRHGSFFQRFRSPWKVELEKAALQQMLAVFVACHVRADLLSMRDIPQVLDILVDGPPNLGHELWSSYGYGSRNEARAHLSGAVTAYSRTELQGWPSILHRALAVAGVPDEKMRASLIVGITRFTQVAEDAIPILRESERARP
jgi:hypothetical protein